MPSNVIDTFYFLFLKSYFADFVRWARTLLVGRELVYSSAMNLEHCFPNTRFKLKLVHTVAGLLQSVFDGDFESFISIISLPFPQGCLKSTCIHRVPVKNSKYIRTLRLVIMCYLLINGPKSVAVSVYSKITIYCHYYVRKTPSMKYWMCP